MLLDRPLPFDRTKTMAHRRLGDELWPEAARDASCSYVSDVRLLAYVVLPRAQPASDDRPAALLTGKCGEVEIVCCGFRSADQGSIPGHWRHSSRMNNRTVTQHRKLRHRTLFQASELFVPIIISSARSTSLSKTAHLRWRQARTLSWTEKASHLKIGTGPSSRGERWA